ncbi:hypothetical protein DMB66_45620 [Actinoplanes sp. ATCC 53533]|uniref:hypothetical protein n=1 Tax=Actinoplanes sp. ATCC 53533 TaxID=1288362 RepID=UPI000F787384|nr:hypothetical protein [Actinoplanes sp. ATCC 53533]RSM48946.1 hypothetical protein DMB66_45620 [Actinoplanes sp. ATCC 53533]
MRISSALFLSWIARSRRGVGHGVLARAAWRRLVAAGARGDANAFTGVWYAWCPDKSQELPDGFASWPVPADLAFSVGWVLTDPQLTGVNRRAVATLVAGSPRAISVAWTACSADPERPVPAELTRCPVPDSAVGDLIRTAEDVRRSARERATVGSLLPDRVLAEWGPRRLASFYALTGQMARLPGIDADGSVLADVLEDVDERTRATIRETVRMAATATAATEVAGPQDWPRRWDSASRLSLADAAAVARSIAGRWQPPDAASRRLFDLLARADPDALAAGRSALAFPAPVRLHTDTAPHSCSFSPDGRWAVVTVPSSRAVSFSKADLTVDWLLFSLPDGNLVERRRRAGVLYDARLADRGENRGYRPAIVVDGHVTGLHKGNTAVAHQMILPRSDGFVREDVILPGRGVPPPYQGGLPHDGTLTFFDAAGHEVSNVRFHRDLGLPDRWHYGLTAVDPLDGRVLVDSGERVWLLDTMARRVLASSPPDTFVNAAAFLAPDRLAMVGSAPGGHSGPYLRIWRVRGDTIEIETEPPHRHQVSSLAVFPGRGEIATVDIEDRLHWSDARTLTEIGGPALPAVTLWDSPDGHMFACPAADRTGVDVFVDPLPARLAALPNLPLADATPADLTAVIKALDDPLPAARPYLELLRGYLELRFGPTG